MRHIHPEIRQRAKELRRPQTPAEERLWSFLQNRQLDGFKFRRQHPIDQFIADFYCAQTKLIIEIDGEYHKKQKDYDQDRTQWLEDNGYHVIRFSNHDALKNTQEVLAAILNHCHSLEE
jgi:very-short-patch-repair endonuclease